MHLLTLAYYDHNGSCLKLPNCAMTFLWLSYPWLIYCLGWVESLSPAAAAAAAESSVHFIFQLAPIQNIPHVQVSFDHLSVWRGSDEQLWSYPQDRHERPRNHVSMSPFPLWSCAVISPHLPVSPPQLIKAVTSCWKSYRCEEIGLTGSGAHKAMKSNAGQHGWLHTHQC